MKNDILRNLALRAKNRMINKNLRDTYSNASVKIIDRTDQSFADKVREIIESDYNICDPIKKLMDEDKLLKMNEQSRERYLFETIEKYHSTRKRMVSKEGIC